MGNEVSRSRIPRNGVPPPNLDESSPEAFYLSLLVPVPPLKTCFCWQCLRLTIFRPEVRDDDDTRVDLKCKWCDEGGSCVLVENAESLRAIADERNREASPRSVEQLIHDAKQAFLGLESSSDTEDETPPSSTIPTIPSININNNNTNTTTNNNNNNSTSNITATTSTTRSSDSIFGSDIIFGIAARSGENISVSPIGSSEDIFGSITGSSDPISSSAATFPVPPFPIRPRDDDTAIRQGAILPTRTPPFRTMQTLLSNSARQNRSVSQNQNTQGGVHHQFTILNAEVNSVQSLLEALNTMVGFSTANSSDLERALEASLNSFTGSPQPTPPELIDGLPRVVNGMIEKSDLELFPYMKMHEKCLCMEELHLHGDSSSLQPSEIPSSRVRGDNEEIDEIIVILPCGHCFHETCIVPWLETANTCPMCRRVVSSTTPTDVPPAEAPSGRAVEH